VVALRYERSGNRNVLSGNIPLWRVTVTNVDKFAPFSAAVCVFALQRHGVICVLNSSQCSLPAKGSVSLK
jgi:hypothetical protein